MRNLLFPAALIAASLAGAAEITSGDSWRIVVPTNGAKGVTAGLKAVSERLKDVLAEGVGAKAKVVLTGDAALPPRQGKIGRIFVGGVFAERAGFPLPADGGLANTIAEKDSDIYLFGHDCPGANADTWQGCTLPSALAAVRFMEKFAGAGFIMPGLVGTEVPKKEKIEVPAGLNDTAKPSLSYGAGRYPGGDIAYCFANGIFGYGAFHTYGGHTYIPACPRGEYFKSHPEYFGMNGGKRSCAGSEGCQAYCISNKGFQELLVAEMLRRYDAGAEVCQLGQQDGGNVCGCPECEAMYGTGKDWGEKFWRFHREIAERIAKERPGKKVHIISYALTTHPPKTFREFPDNVMIELCHYSPSCFTEWKDHRVPGGFTTYMYLWGNYPFPGAVAKHSLVYLAKLARNLRTDGILGIYRCGYGELFGTEGPGYWVFNRTLENPTADIHALIDGYCRFAYGPAADAMKRFHLTLDQRIRTMDLVLCDNQLGAGVPGGETLSTAKPQNSLDLAAYVYSAETVRKLDDLLARAEKTAGLSAKQRMRLGLIRKEYAYARNLGAIATLYAAYRKFPSKALFDPLADLVLERKEMLNGLYDEKGRMRKLPGWREIKVFGGVKKSVLATNGRLSATVGAPLAWDVGFLREKGVLPGTIVRKAEVPRVANVPSIDDFEAGAWAKAAWQEMGGVQMERLSFASRFKVVAGDKALYLGVETELPDNVEVKTIGRDGGVWTTECLDLTIDPKGTKDSYYHLIWSPNDGSVYDATHGMITDPLDPNYKRDFSLWDGEWTVTNRRAGGKWKSLLTLPYATLGATAPKSGERWCMNLGRVAMHYREKGLPQQNALWSPNLESPSFIDAEAMGTLIFK